MKQYANHYFERLTDDNFIHFHELHQRIFGKNNPIDMLKKKYKTKYIIEGYWVYLAFDKTSKKAVASIGVIPWLCNYQDKPVLAAQCTDIMIAKEHSGKGLFALLYQKVAELLKEHDFKFIFGFPNQASYPVFKNRLNWKFYGKLNVYSIPSRNKIPLRKVFYRFPLLRAFHDACLDYIFKKFESENIEILFENRLSAGTLKNRDFYHYKMSKAHKLLRLGNSYFLIKVTNRLLVGDIKLENEAAFDKHLQTLLKLAAKSGVSSVDFMCSEGTDLDRLLSKHSRAVASLPVGFFEVNESQIDYNKISFTLVDLDTF